MPSISFICAEGGYEEGKGVMGSIENADTAFRLYRHEMFGLGSARSTFTAASTQQHGSIGWDIGHI